MKTTKTLLLVCGGVASGKTRLSKKIAAQHGNGVYFDKDDLGELSRVIFEAAKEPYARVGSFFNTYVRNPEYDVSDKIALSALRFNDFVLVNAPYTRELRNEEKVGDARFSKLKAELDKMDGKLVVIWIDVGRELVMSRLVNRYKTDEEAFFRDEAIFGRCPQDADEAILYEYAAKYVDGLNLAVPDLSKSKNVSELHVFDASRSDEPGYFEQFYASVFG